MPQAGVGDVKFLVLSKRKYKKLYYDFIQNIPVADSRTYCSYPSVFFKLYKNLKKNVEGWTSNQAF